MDINSVLMNNTEDQDHEIEIILKENKLLRQVKNGRIDDIQTIIEKMNTVKANMLASLAHRNRLYMNMNTFICSDANNYESEAFNKGIYVDCCFATNRMQEYLKGRLDPDSAVSSCPKANIIKINGRNLEIFRRPESTKPLFTLRADYVTISAKNIEYLCLSLVDGNGI